MVKEREDKNSILNGPDVSVSSNGNDLVPPDEDAHLKQSDDGIDEKKFDYNEYLQVRPKVQGGMDVYVSGMNSSGYEQYATHKRSFVKNGHWSIAWADLMMTMFILFMVMFVYKTADREFLSGEGLGDYTGNKIGRQVVNDGPGGANDFHEYGKKAYSRIFDFSELNILERELQDFAQINLAPDKTLRIILTGDLLFPLGKKEMTGGGMNLLKKIAVFLKETPYKINVVGHTDNLPMRGGDTSSNWELSADRACAVVHYLISETKLPAGQFYVTGHAEYRPVAPNDSPVNRAKNRRVEIIVSKELPGFTPLGGADL